MMLLILPLSAQAAGPSGADALFQALGNDSTVETNAKSAGATTEIGAEAVRLTNPVSRAVFSEVSAGKQLSFEARRWFQKFFADDFEGTAHLWSVMQKELPDPLLQAGRSAYLYSLYRIGLGQTFLNAWVGTLADAPFANSRVAFALEEAIAPDFENWLWTQNVSISADQAAVLSKLNQDRSPVFALLEAQNHLRQGLSAKPALTRLPATSRYRALLAQTVALAQARAGELSEAAKTLKLYYDPWLRTQTDGRVHATYTLQIARLLYQIGSMEGAAAMYRRIPRGSPEYLSAQEELAWVYLRTEDTAALRGNLESFHADVYKDSFRPEVRLIEAISDLKLCHYADSARSVQSYVRENKPYAEKIDAALASQMPPAPPHRDEFAARAIARVALREAERAKLDQLAERSVSAAVPSVGKQKHWIDAVASMTTAIEEAKKSAATEDRRLWKAQYNELQEASRKLQFVRVELVSRLSRQRREKAMESSTAGLDHAEKRKLESTDSERMVFPHDRVVWPDELFQLQSLTNSRCPSVTEKI